MNLYWPIYKNLEQKLLELSEFIHFSDDQENVYSLSISNLLIRTAVEIESLAKELYKLTGGNMTPVDESGKSRTLYFDQDCIQHLDVNWNITKKVVYVVTPAFYFTQQENLILKPLKNCDKPSKGRWKKAYQAIKHNRVESMRAGNIGNLIRAMAALYILNIYYRDEKFDIGTIAKSEPLDARLGSEIFSVSLAHAEKCRFAEEMSDEGIDDAVKRELDSSIYIQKYTDDAFEKLNRDMVEYNKHAGKILIEAPEVGAFLASNPDYKVSNLIALARDAGGSQLVDKIMRGQSILGSLPTAKMEAVLNKMQQIYPTLGTSK